MRNPLPQAVAINTYLALLGSCTLNPVCVTRVAHGKAVSTDRLASVSA